ncbi:MAG: amidase [Roseibium sp.]|nr:amidase [Roseibium sp.]
MVDAVSLPWAHDDPSARVESVFECIETDPACRSVFTKALKKMARARASRTADNPEPLAGALISIKALFDVAGEVTTAGTLVLANDAPATSHAPAIARLLAAGAIPVGLTNMSEFAYSGLGLNPHFGTPANPVYPGCAPGGSTSGGAVSVALGLCDIAIGSDTGGSLRIPAAFNGIVGFKPTQASVPMEGGKPLSDSLDSFGPMARSVAACELAWQVMSGIDTAPVSARPARLIVPRNFGFTEMDPVIAAGFNALLERLRHSGFDIIEKELACKALYDNLPPWHMTAVESRAHYERYFQGEATRMDSRVHARMALADKISAVEYRQTLNRRAQFIAAFIDELGEDLLFLPTTPILPPKLETIADVEAFNRHNLLALRNPSLANVADGCGIALPYKHAGTVLSVMVVGPKATDARLLACAKALEAAL